MTPPTQNKDEIEMKIINEIIETSCEDFQPNEFSQNDMKKAIQKGFEAGYPKGKEDGKSAQLKEDLEEIGKLLDRHIKDILSKKGNAIEMKIYSGKISTLKRIRKEIVEDKLKQSLKTSANPDDEKENSK